MFPPIKTPVFFFNRSTASNTPPLLNPIRLIMAESSFKRNNRFLGYRLGLWRKRTYFYKTKTKIGQSLYKWRLYQIQLQVLLDFLNFNPNTSVSNRLSLMP
jgi:hypothetical protein